MDSSLPALQLSGQPASERVQSLRAVLAANPNRRSFVAAVSCGIPSMMASEAIFAFSSMGSRQPTLTDSSPFPSAKGSPQCENVNIHLFTNSPIHIFTIQILDYAEN